MVVFDTMILPSLYAVSAIRTCMWLLVDLVMVIAGWNKYHGFICHLYFVNCTVRYTIEWYIPDIDKPKNIMVLMAKLGSEMLALYSCSKGVSIILTKYILNAM